MQVHRASTFSRKEFFAITGRLYAGNSFTKAISQSLNLSFEEAEKIKQEKGVIRSEKDGTPVAPTTMRIFNVILTSLKDLVAEIQRSFDYYRSRYKGETVDRVILSGDGKV